jgi:hypothetical protein
MTEVHKSNDNSFISRNNRKSNTDQDNDDIIKKLSQITPNEDKSFESSIVSKNLPKFYDMNYFSKDSNITPFFDNKELFGENNCDDKNTSQKNNKLLLNQKLKYICSLIQISNINIKKYKDLMQFNKYLYNDNLISNHNEPINLLFDIISELIFYIQKEIKNNDLLMKEIKRHKYNKNDNERQIFRLKNTIKEKEKEINELKSIKTDEYYKYNLNEMNELKQENKELYKKINTYKTQMKKVESNNKIILNKLKSYKIEKNYLNINNNTSLNSLNNIKKNDLYNICKLNNSYEDKKSDLIKSAFNNSRKKNTFNLYCCSSKNKTIASDDYPSPSNQTKIKISNFKPIIRNTVFSSSKTDNIYYLTDSNNNDNSKKFNGGTLISSMKLLLKDINNMLNLYNSTLDKIKIGNITKMNDNKKATNDKEKNEQDYKNLKYLNEVLDKMNATIKNLEIKMKGYNNENKSSKTSNSISNNYKKKFIHVNTSKWKFTKKCRKKKEKDKNSFNKNSSASSLKNANNIIRKIKSNLIENKLDLDNDNKPTDRSNE